MLSKRAQRWSVSIPNGDRHYLELSSVSQVQNYLKPVSIPNGDRHYLEPKAQFAAGVTLLVSIPNGDRHYLEPSWGCSTTCEKLFQSPMGIGITSNIHQAAAFGLECYRFNPQWG